MKLKQIRMSGSLKEEWNDPYLYFVDADDPCGDIITMRKPQGGKHTD